jgi:hypothetical protein
MKKTNKYYLHSKIKPFLNYNPFEKVVYSTEEEINNLEPKVRNYLNKLCKEHNYYIQLEIR